MWSVLKLLFWSLVLILALSFFGISIQAIVDSPAGQANFSYVGHLVIQGWNWTAEFVKSRGI